jgi:hypothetical protein
MKCGPTLNQTTADPRTSTPGVDDATLLERAVRSARGRYRKGQKHPRWVGVMDTFALGSGYAHALCRVTDWTQTNRCHDDR